MVSIRSLSGDTLRADSNLQRNLLELLIPTYVDPVPILERELAACSDLYLGIDATGSIVCFFLIEWHALDLQGEHMPALHLGLSATRHDTKSRGYITHLYSRCVQDARARERALGKKALLWSTTAAPTVYLAVANYLAEAEPRPDGSYSERGAMLALELRRRLGADVNQPGDHPFVLPSIAKGTRYSPVELHRISRIARAKRFTLFESLKVDESRHDRLLFIARTPPEIS